MLVRMLFVSRTVGLDVENVDFANMRAQYTVT